MFNNPKLLQNDEHNTLFGAALIIVLLDQTESLRQSTMSYWLLLI